MTNDELQKLAAALADCGKALLKISEVMAVKEDNPSASEAKSEKLEKPLFLHERDAAEDFIACFDGHEAICPRAVVHCYTGDKKTLRRLLDMGFYIGITGWICDERRGDDLREAVSILPLDRVMIETDAPYLTPRGFHLPRTNVPQNITYVARTLAQYMGVSEEVLTKCAKENTERFWGIR